MDTITGKWGPVEIAWGVAFGVLLGLLPKITLLFFLFGLLFVFSRAHLVSGVLLMILVTLLSPFVAPYADQLGADILLSKPGQGIGAALFQFPVVPWTQLDNTVVLGSLLFGLVLFFPLFFVTWLPLKLFWPKTKTQVAPKP